MVDTITRDNTAYRLLQPAAFTNQYAAMPSLHSGWDLLVGIAIVTAAGTAALKAVGYAMPTLMVVAVVGHRQPLPARRRRRHRPRAPRSRRSTRARASTCSPRRLVQARTPALAVRLLAGAQPVRQTLVRSG